MYESHVRYFFERCLHVYGGFADAPGYRTEATIRAGFLSQVGGSGPGGGSANALNLTWRELIDQGFIIAGSPDTVTEQMENLTKRLKVGHIVALMHIGDMPVDKCAYSSRLFAEKVIPRLRDTWKGYEDRWSPHPLPASETVSPREIRARERV